MAISRLKHFIALCLTVWESGLYCQSPSRKQALTFSFVIRVANFAESSAFIAALMSAGISWARRRLPIAQRMVTINSLIAFILSCFVPYIRWSGFFNYLWVIDSSGNRTVRE